ncbi:FadR/GntR family transcriptional regulator [Sinimarinibacterium flocculans]|uniref:FadR/GntR family transcriptional regulator n=1 Tax=Sinimarinibacterium flocculans TaxID=985250 RepID=UPI002492C2E2|nr:FCD domain-containing protein [Sinimarinibacterium flocculans]
MARRIEQAITDGRFRGRLPAERALASQYGVSRATVRDAVGLLVARGLLSRRQGAGTFINDAADRRMAEVWADVVRQHPRLQESLVEFRTVMERRNAELAAARHDAEDRARLLKAAADVDAAYAGSDRRRQIDADVALHRAIAEATHNPVFAQLMNSLLRLLHDHVQLSIAGLAPGSGAAAQLRAQHSALTAAILDRDAERAGRLAEHHMGYVGTILNDLRPTAGHG